MVNGCSYGKVSRNMIDNLSKEVSDGFKRVEKSLDEINQKQIELFNHYSSFYSPEQVSEVRHQKIVNAWLMGIIGAFLGAFLSFIIAYITTK
jgi:hypothetical protein